MRQDWQLFYLFEDPDLGPNFTPATTIPHNTVPGSEARKSIVMLWCYRAQPYCDLDMFVTVAIWLHRQAICKNINSFDGNK